MSAREKAKKRARAQQKARKAKKRAVKAAVVLAREREVENAIIEQRAAYVAKLTEVNQTGDLVRGHATELMAAFETALNQLDTDLRQSQERLAAGFAERVAVAASRYGEKTQSIKYQADADSCVRAGQEHAEHYAALVAENVSLRAKIAGLETSLDAANERAVELRNEILDMAADPNGTPPDFLRAFFAKRRKLGRELMQQEREDLMKRVYRWVGDMMRRDMLFNETSEHAVVEDDGQPDLFVDQNSSSRATA